MTLDTTNPNPIRDELIRQFGHLPVWVVWYRWEYETHETGRMTYEEAVRFAKVQGQWATVAINVEEWS